MVIDCILLAAAVILFLVLLNRMGKPMDSVPEGADDLMAENQEQDHCESCVRWSECNGVDDSCQWRN